MDTLTGHAGPVYSLAFSQEGTLLLSGSADETVRAWDVKRSPAASEHPIVAQRRAARQQQEADQDQLAADPDAMDVDGDGKSAAMPPPPGAKDKKRDAAGMWKAKRVVDSDALLKTWRTKSTPVYNVMMTKCNLAIATGPFAL
ncbi:Transcription initiation factor TFIID subunit 5 [Coemansia spiralis]|nr:Transcription initiation factor TFIID subunit 5 [Coemansia spiralis]